MGGTECIWRIVEVSNGQHYSLRYKKIIIKQFNLRNVKYYCRLLDSTFLYWFGYVAFVLMYIVLA